MRHGALELTIQTCTDPKLLDVVGALKVLPEPPLDDSPLPERQRSTGTDGRRDVLQASDSLVPTGVPNAGNSCTSRANADRMAGEGASAPIVVSDAAARSRDGPTSSVGQRRTRFELVTAGLEGRYSTS